MWSESSRLKFAVLITAVMGDDKTQGCNHGIVWQWRSVWVGLMMRAGKKIRKSEC